MSLYRSRIAVFMTKFDIIFPKDFSDRERASFELGIKLGALFHIAMGMPITKNKDTIQSIEKGLESSIKCQPFVKDVRVTINPKQVFGSKEDEFDYSSIHPACLSAKIHLVYNDIDIVGNLQWDEEGKYPIMYVEKINAI